MYGMTTEKIDLARDLVPALSVACVSVPGEGLREERQRPDSRLIRHRASSEGSKVTPRGKQRG